MYIKIKKQQKGFMHLQFLVVAAVVIVAIGAVGSYVVFSSKAASNYSSNWSDCGINAGFSFPNQTKHTSAGTRTAKTWYVSGPAVRWVTVEYSSSSGGSTLAKWAKQPKDTGIDSKGNHLWKYPYLFPATKTKKYRVATYTLYCPNAKNPRNGTHYNTITRGMYQIPY